LKKISWWQPSEPFLPWLSVVVTRKAIDLRRAWMANRVHLYFSEFAEEPACGDGEPDLEESIEAWRACIPPQRFQVVELLKEGMGLSEIAANLKISQRTLQYWLSEIRAAVRAFNRR
jgi:DNA-directed RNA polymerase specialized sigma24 family protein